MTAFEGVVPALGEALDKRGYSQLTPVQKAVIDPALAGRDLLVSAQTGSGKTVAFGLAFAPDLLRGADRFERANAPLALAVAPTRELALQVRRELEWLYESTGATFGSCVGGMDMRDERRALSRGVHIVVGTPGRLRDHIERGSLDMSEMRAVVLDEADEMLDMGFRDDLEYILGAAPGERRTLMFSATVPRMIATLAKRYQKDAARVSTRAEESQHLDIDYRALTVAPNDRENAIVNILRYFEAQNAIIFCSTRATVNHMTSRFANRGFSVVALSGELSQNERSHALQSMRDGRARVCIATDVAARGIDLPNLELVIHADIPRSPESLVHRSGRTGRAGRKGVCALIVPYNQRRRTEGLLKRAKISATWAKPPTIEEITQRDDERLLGDETIVSPGNENEIELAGRLLQAHSAEQIATAFVRLYRKEQTAPEELIDNMPMERQGDGRREGRRGEGPRRSREDFAGGVWFSLSIGRKQNAEPRWLLPMLCRSGGLTKQDIGAIRIEHGQTSVELAPKCVDRFLESIGPDKTIEKNIIVKRLDSAPKGGSRPPAKGGEARRYDKKRPFGEKKKPADRARPKHREQTSERSGRQRDERPDRTEKRAKPAYKARDGAGAKPRSTAKPAEPETREAKSKAARDPDWNPLDASSSGRSGGRAATGEKRGKASETSKRKRPAPKGGKKKLSPSKLRRAKAREKLQGRSSGSSASKDSATTPGMAPRKRKKPKDD